MSDRNPADSEAWLRALMMMVVMVMLAGAGLGLRGGKEAERGCDQGCDEELFHGSLECLVFDRL